MIIRWLTQNDVVQHDKISSQAFVYACDVHDPASALPCEKVLGAFDDDNETLLADFEIHEKQCHFDGGLLTCAAVGGVAAKPEHRGKGYGKALLNQLARIAVERGCGRLEWWCLDWNRPSIDFYLSLGAEPMADWTVYRLTGETLKEMAK